MSTKNVTLLVCDIQTRFRSAIHAYDHVVSNTNKMLKIAKVLNHPVIVTSQNAKALGPVDPNLDFASLGPLHLGTIDKSRFSMVIPEVEALLKPWPQSIVVMGIESHICILQTVIDLVQQNSARSLPTPSDIYVVADAVSSCNQFEVPLAFDTMRQLPGVKVVTSESLAFMLMRDASLPPFKEFARVIKDSKDSTRVGGEALFSSSKDGA